MAQRGSTSQIRALSPELSEVIEYRKSGLSLNHVVGCPLDCSYCIRHVFSNFDLKRPTALMEDAEAVERLVDHRFFRRDVTPIQIFNRATDPFLPAVKTHLFECLRLLDEKGLRNHVLVITRWRVTKDDCLRLNALKNLRLSLLVTHSGIGDRRLEPTDSSVGQQSLRLAYELAQSYRVVLYWRPIIPGVNDHDSDVALASQLSRSAHATVFTGLFYRKAIADYFESAGLPPPYESTARRKILPRALEQSVLQRFTGSNLFRKTSCAVSFAHGLPDYNGHVGIRELCDICPSGQVTLCEQNHHTPREDDIRREVQDLGGRLVSVRSQAATVEGLNEESRYLLQHRYRFQIHDVSKPHRFRQHGRASTGWD